MRSVTTEFISFFNYHVREIIERHSPCLIFFKIMFLYFGIFFQKKSFPFSLLSLAIFFPMFCLQLVNYSMYVTFKIHCTIKKMLTRILKLTLKLDHTTSERSSDKTSATVSSTTIINATTSIGNRNVNFILYTWRHTHILLSNIREIILCLISYAMLFNIMDIGLAYFQTEMFLSNEKKKKCCAVRSSSDCFPIGFDSSFYSNFRLPCHLVPVPPSWKSILWIL